MSKDINNRINIKRVDFLKSSHGIANIVIVLLTCVAFYTWQVIAYKINISNVFYFILNIVFTGCFLRYLSEWVHEGIHYNIHPSRIVNDFLCTWMLAPLFGVPFAVSRAAHFSHHGAKQFFDKDDPDTKYLNINSRKEFFLSFLQDLLGVSAVKAYLSIVIKRVVNEKTDNRANAFIISYAPIIIFHACLLVIVLYYGAWLFFLSYYFGMISVYPFFGRLRVYGQHLFIDGNGNWNTKNSPISRTIEGSLWDKVFISSKLMLNHYEHHKNPGLPFRALEHIKVVDMKNINQNTFSHMPILKALFLGKCSHE